MKSAKEMFSELGYSCKEDDDYIEYILKIWDCTYEIAFNYDTECIEFYYYRDAYDNKYDVSLTMKELQAINKQVEELHWNDTIVNIDVKLDGKKVMEAMRGGNNA